MYKMVCLQTAWKVKQASSPTLPVLLFRHQLHCVPMLVNTFQQIWDYLWDGKKKKRKLSRQPWSKISPWEWMLARDRTNLPAMMTSTQSSSLPTRCGNALMRKWISISQITAMTIGQATCVQLGSLADDCWALMQKSSSHLMACFSLSFLGVEPDCSHSIFYLVPQAQNCKVTESDLVSGSIIKEWMLASLPDDIPSCSLSS